ncbi:MAG: DUF4270 domain-containing protein [Phocaeicola sp.]
MKFNYFFALLLAIATCSCDDSTPDIGSTVIPDGDHIASGVASYKVQTHSLLLDSVYARTSTAYLGKYTDSQYGEFTADFLTQFNCLDNFEFPETIQEVSGIDLSMTYNSFFGDSLSSMHMQIDTLDTVVPEDKSNMFYTNVDPTLYYNESISPIASVAYSATGVGVFDTIVNNVRIITQTIKLPKDLGVHMYNKYKEDKANYKDSEAFIKNVLKGMYVHCTHGDGTVLYVEDLGLRLWFTYLIKSSSGKVDSLVTGNTNFPVTKEVVQSNRIQNSDRLKELVKDPSCTYLKTPAGIITEAVLPLEEISEKHEKDTLNAASISFTRYTEEIESAKLMPAPSLLLLTRKTEMNSFFEKNKIADNISSYIIEAGSGATANTYTYDNIAQLIMTCLRERDKGLKDNPNWLIENPDWNKIVLIPVVSNSIGYENNLRMGSAKLKGGTEAGNELDLKILYTTFDKK